MPDESGLGTVRARRTPAVSASALPGTPNDPFSLKNIDVRRPLEEVGWSLVEPLETERR